ncbi:MAG: hypothetical protein M5R42_14705 [Rhodocyclaceae bacterium]|nr:hypothetical protein [Rhodocyclaceae bacterium]
MTGRTIEPFLPQGDDAREWRRFINEAQVLLHNHPINMAREAEGRPTVNSLWPWGPASCRLALVPRLRTSMPVTPWRGAWRNLPMFLPVQYRRGLKTPCRRA